MEVTGEQMVEINVVCMMKFSKCKVTAGATERSSPRVMTAEDLSKGSGTKHADFKIGADSEDECEVSRKKCGASGKSGGSGICLDATGSHKGGA